MRILAYYTHLPALLQLKILWNLHMTRLLGNHRLGNKGLMCFQFIFVVCWNLLSILCAFRVNCDFSLQCHFLLLPPKRVIVSPQFSKVDTFEMGTYNADQMCQTKHFGVLQTTTRLLCFRNFSHFQHCRVVTWRVCMMTITIIKKGSVSSELMRLAVLWHSTDKVITARMQWSESLTRMLY